MGWGYVGVVRIRTVVCVNRVVGDCHRRRGVAIRRFTGGSGLDRTRVARLRRLFRDSKVAPCPITVQRVGDVTRTVRRPVPVVVGLVSTSRRVIIGMMTRSSRPRTGWWGLIGWVGVVDSWGSPAWVYEILCVRVGDGVGGRRVAIVLWFNSPRKVQAPNLLVHDRALCPTRLLDRMRNARLCWRGSYNCTDVFWCFLDGFVSVQPRSHRPGFNENDEA